jgi:hypothetical protein
MTTRSIIPPEGALASQSLFFHFLQTERNRFNRLKTLSVDHHLEFWTRRSIENDDFCHSNLSSVHRYLCVAAKQQPIRCSPIFEIILLSLRALFHPVVPISIPAHAGEVIPNLCQVEQPVV